MNRAIPSASFAGKKRARAFTALSAFVLAGCDVPPPPGSAGAADGGACPATLVVVESDYTSTNIALVAMDGRVLTGSLASSATAGLGGDVVPTTMPTRGRVTLLDRGQVDRIVWIDPTTAAKSDLPVATGFPSDPMDYADVAPGKAYVPRYAQNASAGREPFDTGSDVLVVDPDRSAITGSIDMRPAVADTPGVEPRPNHVVTFDGRALVLLAALSSDYSSQGTPQLVEIDPATDRVVTTLALAGFSNCMGLTKSPFGPQLTVSCTGPIDSAGTASTLTGSGLVVVDVTAAPAVTHTFQATDFGTNPIGYWAAYAAPNVLLFQSFGHLGSSLTPVADDILTRLDLTTGDHSVALRSSAFSLGGVVCEPSCGACFATDADHGGVLHRFDLDAAGVLSNETSITVERTIGLPPRDLGVVER